MRLNSNLILRQVGGEYMIVNPFSETMDMAQVYSLNETAAWLWKQLENKEFTVDEAAGRGFGFQRFGALALQGVADSLHGLIGILLFAGQLVEHAGCQ